eukprot:11846566-Prorocentrum_lima.AAC.1
MHAWEETIARLSAKRFPWQSVAGPMAAVVATLLDLSWVPVSPTLWRTDRGEEIRLDRGGIEPL